MSKNKIWRLADELNETADGFVFNRGYTPIRAIEEAANVAGLVEVSDNGVRRVYELTRPHTTQGERVNAGERINAWVAMLDDSDPAICDGGMGFDDQVEVE